MATKISIASKYAGIIRTAKTVYQLEEAIATATKAASQMGKVPLLSDCPYPVGSTVLCFEDVSFMFVVDKDDGDVRVNVPRTNAGVRLARLVTNGDAKGLTQEQYDALAEGRRVATIVYSRVCQLLEILKHDPTAENLEALTTLTTRVSQAMEIDSKKMGEILAQRFHEACSPKEKESILEEAENQATDIVSYGVSPRHPRVKHFSLQLPDGSSLAFQKNTNGAVVRVRYYDDSKESQPNLAHPLPHDYSRVVNQHNIPNQQRQRSSEDGRDIGTDSPDRATRN